MFVTSAVAAGAASRAGAPSAGELPFRQIHLDFHTSELIPEVGADFDSAAFAATLKQARVNSINVFAKCHHGYAYYNSRIAARHPNLRPGLDLLGEMVAACRKEGIHVLYYYSLVWDVLTSRKHPEWRALLPGGKPIGGPPTDQWPWLCMNTPYLDQVIRENEELIANYDVGGAWFDILKQPPEGCFCRWCVDDRKSLGLDASPAGIRKHNKLVAMRVEKRLNEVVHKRFPNGLTFYNSRLVVGVRDELDYYSHIEIESLPTGGWGYTHFQQRVRYMRTLGKQMVGMTGRFHKSWGDFGGYKNQAALDFECLNFVANGAKCCVGDQLHPRGRLDALTYSRIGKTYEKIEALEPWARGTKAVADIGIVSTALFNTESTQKITPADQGFTNMFVELHQQFNVIDLEEDFSRYKLIVLPDEIQPSPGLIAKLDRFAAAGGAVIASQESLLDKAKGDFAWPALGVRYKGPARFQGQYLTASPAPVAELGPQAWYLYQPGLEIEALAGTEVLGRFVEPYFDRSPERFSSHKQTPPSLALGSPALTLRGRVVYIANPFFRSYAQDAVGLCRDLVGTLLSRLLPRPAVIAPKLPSTAQVTVLEQPAHNRVIAHLLHYPMTRRAPDIDIIEDPGILLDQVIKVRLDKAPQRVELAPQRRVLPFRYEDGYAVVVLDRVIGHQAVSFEL
jgi:hypothetical protein